MTKAIRWSPEQLDAHMARRAASAQAAVERIQGGAVKSDPVPAAAPPVVKPAKYRNKKVEQDGIVHDSGKEARRWAVLQAQEAAGEIVGLQRQVAFELAPAVRLAGEDRKKPALRYFADFTYVRDGQLVVEDVKSKPTRKLPAYRIKRHLMATIHKIQITEV